MGDLNANVGERVDIKSGIASHGLGKNNSRGTCWLLYDKQKSGHSNYPLHSTQKKKIHLEITIKNVCVTSYDFVCIIPNYNRPHLFVSDLYLLFQNITLRLDHSK